MSCSLALAARRKAYGHAVRGLKCPSAAALGCHSECRQSPTQWDCRTGLGLTLWHWRLNEMLEVATLGEDIFTKLI